MARTIPFQSCIRKLIIFLICLSIYLLSVNSFPAHATSYDPTIEPWLQTPGTIAAFSFVKYRLDNKYDDQDHPRGGFTICINGGKIKQPSCKTSESTGWARWDNIPAGKYQITEQYNEKQNQAGWALVIDGEEYTATVSKSSKTHYEIKNQDMVLPWFANRLAEIHGHTFLDSPQDGKYSLDKKLLGGFQLYLDLDNNGKLDNGKPWSGCVTGTKMSDCIGKDSEPFLISDSQDSTFHFRNLPKGTYTLHVVPKPGWKLTTVHTLDRTDNPNIVVKKNEDSWTVTVNGRSPYPWLNFGFIETPQASDSAQTNKPAAPPLTISNPHVTKIDKNSATIAWDMNTPAYVRIFYDTIPHSPVGLRPLYGNYGYYLSTSGIDETAGTHTMTITGLDLTKTYYYRIAAASSQFVVSDPETSFNATSLTPTASPFSTPGPSNSHFFQRAFDNVIYFIWKGMIAPLIGKH